jgi:hypothetical protein
VYVYCRVLRQLEYKTLITQEITTVITATLLLSLKCYGIFHPKQIPKLILAVYHIITGKHVIHPSNMHTVSVNRNVLYLTLLSKVIENEAMILKCCGNDLYVNDSTLYLHTHIDKYIHTSTSKSNRGSSSGSCSPMSGSSQRKYYDKYIGNDLVSNHNMILYKQNAIYISVLLGSACPYGSVYDSLSFDTVMDSMLLVSVVIMEYFVILNNTSIDYSTMNIDQLLKNYANVPVYFTHIVHMLLSHTSSSRVQYVRYLLWCVSNLSVFLTSISQTDCELLCNKICKDVMCHLLRYETISSIKSLSEIDALDDIEGS